MQIYYSPDEGGGAGPEPTDAGIADTGSAEAGADETAGGGEHAPSIDNVPKEVRDQIWNTAWGKAMETAEKRAEEQYGVYRDAWETLRAEKYDPDTWDLMLQHMPGLKSRIEQLQSGGGEFADQDPTEDLKRQVNQLRQQMAASQMQTFTRNVMERVEKAAGNDEVKRDLILLALSRNMKDPNTPNWTLDDVDQFAKDIDERMQERDQRLKSQWVEKKKSSKSAGAEGAAGTPRGPEPPENIGDPEQGFRDPNFQEAVLSILEGDEQE